jgi:hypothetical protein
MSFQLEPPNDHVTPDFVSLNTILTQTTGPNREIMEFFIIKTIFPIHTCHRFESQGGESMPFRLFGLWPCIE